MHSLAYEYARSVASKEIILISEGCEVPNIRHCDYRYVQLCVGTLKSVDRERLAC